MTREQLEHIIRTASAISEDPELVIIGSQSILGQFPEAPQALLVSMEADVYPKNHPERWDLIDGSIGEGSPLHETFGYYAQGVGEEATMWWAAVTLTTVGYGDVYPVTPLGKFLTVVVAFFGIGLFALPTGILASGFMQEALTTAVQEGHCPTCGRRVDRRPEGESQGPVAPAPRNP